MDPLEKVEKTSVAVTRLSIPLTDDEAEIIESAAAINRRSAAAEAYGPDDHLQPAGAVRRHPRPRCDPGPEDELSAATRFHGYVLRRAPDSSGARYSLVRISISGASGRRCSR